MQPQESTGYALKAVVSTTADAPDRESAKGPSSPPRASRRRALVLTAAVSSLLLLVALGAFAAGAALGAGARPVGGGSDEGVVVLHAAGRILQDDDVNALFDHLRAGERDLTLQVLDDGVGIHGIFSLRVEHFNLGLQNTSSGASRHILLINPGTGGCAIGNTTITALLCKPYDVVEANCTFEERQPRALLDDNEADVIKHAITYGVIGVVVLACIFACTPAHLAAIPSLAGCFPSRATVQTLAGVQAMKSLSIGTLLLTSQGYSPIFLSGHHDPQAVTTMVRLVTASNHTLTITPDHYLPLGSGAHRSAARVVPGDRLLVQGGDGLLPSEVTSVGLVEEQGLFNPYTVAGDLVVDGVLASCHSSWFLEGFLSEDRIVPAYEAAFAPLISLYAAFPGWFVRFGLEFAKDRRALHEVGALGITAAALRALPGR